MQKTIKSSEKTKEGQTGPKRTVNVFWQSRRTEWEFKKVSEEKDTKGGFGHTAQEKKLFKKDEQLGKRKSL